MHAADVVDEHVDPSEVLHGASHEARGAVRLGQIDRHRGDALEPGQALHAAAAGDDDRAFRGEGLGHGSADALARACDHRDLVRELQIHAPPLSPRALADAYANDCT